MLQIISGKFFSSADRHIAEAKGVTYANYTWTVPIKTCVATLEPAGLPSSGICAYIIAYTNQIEKEPPNADRKASLVRIGDADVVRQFECIAAFGLQCQFGGDRSEIEFACRSQPKDASDPFVPQHFVPRFFAPHNMGKVEEVEWFAKLVAKIIGLPRKTYVGVIAALETFRHAMQVLSHNVDMAYSLLVYCLESLSQQFDGYQPVWEDCEDALRKDIDALQADVGAENADLIRSAILRSIDPQKTNVGPRRLPSLPNPRNPARTALPVHTYRTLVS